MPSVDVHQRLWPEGVLAVLERRSEAPRARWAGGRWRVELDGEPFFEIDAADHLAGARLRVGPGMTALAPAALRETLLSWAERPELWSPLVRHDAAERSYALLHRTSGSSCTSCAG